MVIAEPRQASENPTTTATSSHAPQPMGRGFAPSGTMSSVGAPVGDSSSAFADTVLVVVQVTVGVQLGESLETILQPIGRSVDDHVFSSTSGEST